MSSIRKNVGYNIILNLVNVLFPIITIPYISRILGTENIGVVNFSLTYSGYFLTIATLGIPIYGMREIAKYTNDKKRRSQVFCEIFSLNVLTALFVTIIYVLTIFLIPTLSAEREIMLLSGVTLYLCAFSIDWYFLGRERFAFITLRSLIVKILCLLGLFLFIKTRHDITNYLLIVVLSTVLSNIYNFWYLLRHEIIWSLKKITYSHHLKPVLLLFSIQIFVTLYTVMDTLMLGFLSTFVQVGLYTSVTRTVKTLMGIVNSSGQATAPKISFLVTEQQTESIQNLINRSTQFLSFMAVPLALGTGLVSSHFIPFFLGNDFTGSIILMQMMSGLFIVYALNGICFFQILIPYSKDKFMLYSTIVGAILNLLLNIVLIPKFAAMGAMASTIMTEIIVTMFLIYYVYRLTPIRLDFAIVLKDVFICLPFIAIHYGCSIFMDTNLSYLLLMVVACTCYYCIVQYLSKNYVLFQILTPLMRKIR